MRTSDCIMWALCVVCFLFLLWLKRAINKCPVCGDQEVDGVFLVWCPTCHRE